MVRKVSDLFVQDEKRWNEGLIREVFVACEAEEILRIPLAACASGDQLVWRGERDGLYSVRSGYRYLNTACFSTNATSLVDLSDSQRNFYDVLWKLKIPEKVKIIVWLFYHNYVPTLQNLYTKHIALSMVCSRCGAAVESALHAVRDCGDAAAVWGALGFNWTPANIGDTVATWLETCFQSSSVETCSLITVTVWAVWYARNKQVHEGRRQKVTETVCFVRTYLLELSALCVLKCPVDRNYKENWRPPDQDYVKVNVDASFNSATKEAGTGVMVRNEHGLVMGSCMIRNRFVSDAFAAEALACKQGLEFALDLGHSKVVLESDSKSVITKLQKVGVDRSLIGPYIEDGKVLILRFRDCKLNFVHRTANDAADFLARTAVQAMVDTYLVEEAPMEVSSFIDKDRRRIREPG